MKANESEASMAFSLFKKREEVTPDTREQDKVLGDPGTLSDILLTTIMSGNKITKEQALTIPAVSSNVDFISNMIASMPFKLYKYKKGKVEEVEGDSRTRLLNSDTGDTLDAFQMKKTMVSDYLLDKGGYAYIQKYRNEYTGLYYVDPVYMVFDYDYQPIYKSYKIFVGDSEYKPWEFIKLLRKPLMALGVPAS